MATNPTVTIQNVYFYYASVAESRLKYGSKTEKEYGVTVVISKDEAKAFKKLKLNKTIKEVDNADFEAAYKTKPPFEGQEEQYLFTITQNVTNKDGDLLPDFLRPKTYLQDENGNLVLGTDTLIGNGSFGDVRYITREGVNGVSLKLHSIKVTTLIPYVKTGGDEWANAVVSPSKSDASGVGAAPASPSADDDLPF